MQKPYKVVVLFCPQEALLATERLEWPLMHIPAMSIATDHKSGQRGAAASETGSISKNK
jgi:hypothetical protein